jgi:hypothetical protein
MPSVEAQRRVECGSLRFSSTPGVFTCVGSSYVPSRTWSLRKVKSRERLMLSREGAIGPGLPIRHVHRAAAMAAWIPRMFAPRLSVF